MIKLRQQSSTSYPMPFIMVDSTDHVSGKTGLSPTVTLSKNGAAFAAASGAVAEVGNGLYTLAGNAADRDTIGELFLHATATGADPVDDRYQIVQYDPFGVFDSSSRVDIGSVVGQSANFLLNLSTGGTSSTSAITGTTDLDTTMSYIETQLKNYMQYEKPFFIVTDPDGRSHEISAAPHYRAMVEMFNSLLDIRSRVQQPFTIKQFMRPI